MSNVEVAERLKQIIDLLSSLRRNQFNWRLSLLVFGLLLWFGWSVGPALVLGTVVEGLVGSVVDVYLRRTRAMGDRPHS